MNNIQKFDDNNMTIQGPGQKINLDSLYKQKAIIDNLINQARALGIMTKTEILQKQQEAQIPIDTTSIEVTPNETPA